MIESHGCNRSTVIQLSFTSAWQLAETAATRFIFDTKILQPSEQSCDLWRKRDLRPSSPPYFCSRSYTIADPTILHSRQEAP